MSDEPEDSPIKRMPIRDLKFEPLAEDLLDSPAMQPYMDLAAAMMGQRDLAPATAEIVAMPLEKRYVWRVASALQWAFADMDTLTVEVDRQTLSMEDRRRLLELVKHRPLQFCLFLSTLFGQKAMEVLMLSAIKNARTVAGQSGGPEHT
jgi:hypothetical protein